MTKIRFGPVWLSSLLVALVLILASRNSEASAPAGRYTISNGTVLDNQTGLTWQQTISTNKYSWSNAQSYCASLNLSGTGWRLPSVKELMTLVDFTVPVNSGTATIDGTAFPNAPADWFWSSTVVGNNVWDVYFGAGDDGSDYPGTAFHVRCVR